MTAAGMFWTTGPELRDQVLDACKPVRRHPMDLIRVEYRYADDAGKRAIEWTGTHLRLTISWVATTPGESLVDPIADAVESLPGCVHVERIRQTVDRRALVRALFDRRTAP